MNVSVHILFNDPGPQDAANLKSLGRELTNNRESVRVFAIPDRPGWLACEFTMPTTPQYRAVERIDRELRFHVLNRVDSAIGFPKSEAEQRRADRKNERARAKRCAKHESAP